MMIVRAVTLQTILRLTMMTMITQAKIQIHSATAVIAMAVTAAIVMVMVKVKVVMMGVMRVTTWVAVAMEQLMIH